MSKQKHGLSGLCKNRRWWHQQIWLRPTRCFQTLHWIKTFIDTRSVCSPWLQTNIWHVLKTSWLQLGKTARFLYREVFLLLSEGVFLSEHVFEPFDCRTQPSWQDHTTRLRHIILRANTPTDEYISAFLRNRRRRSHHQLLNYNSADDDGRSSIRKHHLSHSWLIRQVAEAHFSEKTSYLVAGYGWNVCDR